MAWSRWVLVGTANVIIHYYNDTTAVVGLNDSFFSGFLFTIIVGILIGVASVCSYTSLTGPLKTSLKNEEKEPRNSKFHLFVFVELGETLIEPFMALAMCIVIILGAKSFRCKRFS